MRGQNKGPESTLVVRTQFRQQEDEMKKIKALNHLWLVTRVTTGKNGFKKYPPSVQKKFNTDVPTRDKARRGFQAATQYANLVALKGEGSFRAIPVIIKQSTR